MEYTDLTDGDLLPDEVKINLHMLGALMLNGVVEEVCRGLSGCPPRGIPKVVGFGLGCAEIRNSKVQATQDLDRFRPQYA